MIKELHAKLILSFLIVFSLFLGKDISKIGIIVGSVFIISELLRKKIELIGLLFILTYVYTGLKSFPFSWNTFHFVEALNTDGEGRGVFIFILPEYFMNLNLGSFNISFPFVIRIFFFIYFFYTIFNNYNLFAKLPIPLIVLFALFYIPTIIGFIIAAKRGTDGSLAPLKCLFNLTTIFYGYTYSILKKDDVLKVIFYLKKRYIYVLSALMIVGLMYNHILFIFLGIAASTAVYILLFEKNIIKFFLLLLAIYIGSVKSTFTILLIPLVSGLITYLSFTLFSSKVRNILPKLGLLIYIVFLAFVLTTPKEQIKLREKTTVENKLYNKIYGDRFFVWHSYLEVIKKNNPFFVVPRKTIELETVYDTEQEISFGAHNSLIQVLYYFGVVYGVIIFIILFYFMNMMMANSSYLPKFIQSMVYGLFSTFIVFGLTGHSIITHAASLFFWLFVGIIVGLGQQYKQSYMKCKK
jgi:hypothetical protein